MAKQSEFSIAVPPQLRETGAYSNQMRQTTESAAVVEVAEPMKEQESGFFDNISFDWLNDLGSTVADAANTFAVGWAQNRSNELYGAEATNTSRGRLSDQRLIGGTGGFQGQGSFFEQNKTLVYAGGAILLAFIAYKAVK